MYVQHSLFCYYFQWNFAIVSGLQREYAVKCEDFIVFIKLNPLRHWLLSGHIILLISEGTCFSIDLCAFLGFVFIEITKILLQEYPNSKIKWKKRSFKNAKPCYYCSTKDNNNNNKKKPLNFLLKNGSIKSYISFYTCPKTLSS